MPKIAFYDTKPYDKIWFNRLNHHYNFDIMYLENKLNCDTAVLANDCDGVVAFVNDTIDSVVIDSLSQNNVKIVAMRCAGYNNVDFKSAAGRVRVVTVPAYSPNSIAEHAIALLLTLVRHIHRAYNRTRDGNFSINGLTGFNLSGKTIGVIGTGRIGRAFIDICRGFGMKVLAYDPFPLPDSGIEYVDLPTLYCNSDIISLHCPLNKDTYHMLDKRAIDMICKNAVIINTSRGALIDSDALLDALLEERIAGAVLDVYEEEGDIFFEDFSGTIIKDEILSRLTTLPNVIVTSHQAFLTHEALEEIARTTLENLKAYFNGQYLENEITY